MHLLHGHLARKGDGASVSIEVTALGCGVSSEGAAVDGGDRGLIRRGAGGVDHAAVLCGLVARGLNVIQRDSASIVIDDRAVVGGLVVLDLAAGHSQLRAGAEINAGRSCRTVLQDVRAAQGRRAHTVNAGAVSVADAVGDDAVIQLHRTITGDINGAGVLLSGTVVLQAAVGEGAGGSRQLALDIEDTGGILAADTHARHIHVLHGERTVGINADAVPAAHTAIGGAGDGDPAGAGTLDGHIGDDLHARCGGGLEVDGIGLVLRGGDGQISGDGQLAGDGHIALKDQRIAGDSIGHSVDKGLVAVLDRAVTAYHIHLTGGRHSGRATAATATATTAAGDDRGSAAAHNSTGSVFLHDVGVAAGGIEDVDVCNRVFHIRLAAGNDGALAEAGGGVKAEVHIGAFQQGVGQLKGHIGGKVDGIHLHLTGHFIDRNDLGGILVAVDDVAFAAVFAAGVAAVHDLQRTGGVVDARAVAGGDVIGHGNILQHGSAAIEEQAAGLAGGGTTVNGGILGVEGAGAGDVDIGAVVAGGVALDGGAGDLDLSTAVHAAAVVGSRVARDGDVIDGGGVGEGDAAAVVTGDITLDHGVFDAVVGAGGEDAAAAGRALVIGEGTAGDGQVAAGIHTAAVLLLAGGVLGNKTALNGQIAGGEDTAAAANGLVGGDGGIDHGELADAGAVLGDAVHDAAAGGGSLIVLDDGIAVDGHGAEVVDTAAAAGGGVVLHGDAGEGGAGCRAAVDAAAAVAGGIIADDGGSADGDGIGAGDTAAVLAGGVALHQSIFDGVHGTGDEDTAAVEAAGIVGVAAAGDGQVAAGVHTAAVLLVTGGVIGDGAAGDGQHTGGEDTAAAALGRVGADKAAFQSKAADGGLVRGGAVHDAGAGAFALVAGDGGAVDHRGAQIVQAAAGLCGGVVLDDDTGEIHGALGAVVNTAAAVLTGVAGDLAAAQVGSAGVHQTAAALDGGVAGDGAAVHGEGVEVINTAAVIKVLSVIDVAGNSTGVDDQSAVVADAAGAAGDVHVGHGDNGILKVGQANGDDNVGTALGTLAGHVGQVGNAILDVDVLVAADIHGAVFQVQGAAVAGDALGLGAAEGEAVHLDRTIDQLSIGERVVAKHGAPSILHGQVYGNDIARAVVDGVVAAVDDGDILQIQQGIVLIVDAVGPCVCDGAVHHLQRGVRGLVVDGGILGGVHGDVGELRVAVVVEAVATAVGEFGVLHGQRGPGEVINIAAGGRVGDLHVGDNGRALVGDGVVAGVEELGAADRGLAAVKEGGAAGVHEFAAGDGDLAAGEGIDAHIPRGIELAAADGKLGALGKVDPVHTGILEGAVSDRHSAFRADGLLGGTLDGAGGKHEGGPLLYRDTDLGFAAAVERGAVQLQRGAGRHDDDAVGASLHGDGAAGDGLITVDLKRSCKGEVSGQLHRGSISCHESRTDGALLLSFLDRLRGLHTRCRTCGACSAGSLFCFFAAACQHQQKCHQDGDQHQM